MFFAIVVLLSIITGALAGYAVVVAKGVPERRNTRRVKELENALDNLLGIAYENRLVDPSLADIMIDEIKQIKKKELG